MKLCQDFNTGSDHDQIRLECAQGLVDFYNYLKDSEDIRSLSKAALDDFADVGRRICTYYAALSVLSASGWKLTPKFHLLSHLTRHTAKMWGNPKHYSCYCDEDMVGHMTEVAESCHSASVATVSLYKYAVMLTMQE